MVRFIFIRHGKTVDNENMKLSGFIDSKLSDIGYEQVKKVAKRLENEKIDVMYSSPLSRALETANEINKNRNCQIKINESFKEMNFGKFEGLTFNEISKNHFEEFEKLKQDTFKYKFPDGESTVEFHDRIAKTLDILIEKYDNKHILIVSHSGVIRSSISHLLSRGHSYHWNFKIDNCSISIVEVVDGFAVIHTLNNIEHLSDL